MEREKNGRFKKGNQAAKGKERPDILKRIKSDTREEIYKCAHSLTKPYTTLKDDLQKEGASRLEYLTAKAVASKNYKFVTWLLEMVVGKANNILTDADNGQAKEIILKYSLGEKDGK